MFLERRLERCSAEKRSGQAQCVHFSNKLVRANPRRAEEFEGTRRAAALRKVCGLQQAQTWVYRCGVERGHVWRREDPRQAGFIEPHGALPILHWQHTYVGIRKRLASELFGEFPDGTPMADGNRVHAHEG